MHRLSYRLLAMAVATLWVVGSCLTCALTATGARAEERRLALLVGNKDYQAGIGTLQNPVNDVTIVAAALRKAGFDVTVVENGGRRGILSAVFDYAARLRDAGSDAVGFFYYSGHGVARPDDRTNYLIPIDATDLKSRDAWIDMIPLDQILNELNKTAPQAAHFIAFDACRNELQLPVRGSVKGFVPVEQRPGMFISFSTSPNDFATDEGEKSGPYAGALAAELSKAGQHHRDMFHAVKTAVYQTTGRRQLGWERDGYLGTIYFAGAAATAGTTPARPPPAIELSARIWQDIKDTTSRGALKAFIKEFPGTIHAELATERLKALEAAGVGAIMEIGATSGKAAPPWPAWLREVRDNPALQFTTIHFATNRRRLADKPAGSGSVQFGTDMGDQLSIGRLAVTMPRERKVGTIPMPGMLTPHAVDKHATLHVADVLATDVLAASIAASGKGGMGKPEVLLFVHGWNSSFENAAFRAAQLAQDIGFDGPLVLFSWPSASSTTGYIRDLETARASSRALSQFYDLLRTDGGVGTIHVLAHSTAAAPVLGMLDELSRRNLGRPDGVLGQTIFAAPDIGRNEFEQRARSIAPIAQGMTLYASDNDRALRFASSLAGGVARAGEIAAAGPLIVAGVDTIDVSALSQGTFSVNHSSFAETSPLLSDMARLLRRGQRPPDLRSPAISPVQGKDGAVYWRYGQ